MKLEKKIFRVQTRNKKSLKASNFSPLIETTVPSLYIDLIVRWKEKVFEATGVLTGQRNRVEINSKDNSTVYQNKSIWFKQFFLAIDLRKLHNQSCNYFHASIYIKDTRKKNTNTDSWFLFLDDVSLKNLLLTFASNALSLNELLRSFIELSIVSSMVNTKWILIQDATTSVPSPENVRLFPYFQFKILSFT